MIKYGKDMINFEEKRSVIINSRDLQDLIYFFRKPESERNYSFFIKHLAPHHWTYNLDEAYKSALFRLNRILGLIFESPHNHSILKVYARELYPHVLEELTKILVNEIEKEKN